MCPGLLNSPLSGSITLNLWAIDCQKLIQALGKRKLKHKIVCFIFLQFVLDAIIMQCYGAVVCIFTAFQAAMIKNRSVELFYKMRNGWDQSGLMLGYSLVKLLKKLAYNFTVIQVWIESILFHET